MAVPGRTFRGFVFVNEDRGRDIHCREFLAGVSSRDRRLFERIAPRRKRSIARFSMVRHVTLWQARQMPACGFTQGGDGKDARSLKRVFTPTGRRVTEFSGTQDLLIAVARMFEDVQPGVRELEITLHQVCIFLELDGKRSILGFEINVIE
jgi:hypothetical protein